MKDVVVKPSRVYTPSELYRGPRVDWFTLDIGLEEQRIDFFYAGTDNPCLIKSVVGYQLNSWDFPTDYNFVVQSLEPFSVNFFNFTGTGQHEEVGHRFGGDIGAFILPQGSSITLQIQGDGRSSPTAQLLIAVESYKIEDA